MVKKSLLLIPFAFVLVIPFVFKRESLPSDSSAQDKLVIITPHNEALRYEFGKGFASWYQRETGRSVALEWRYLGGTQDAIRYVDAGYFNAFKFHWENTLGREWTNKVQEIFEKRLVLKLKKLDPESLEHSVIGAFKNSEVSSGIDLFFGGGKMDMVFQARKGQIVPSDIKNRKPEWFNHDAIPESIAGNTLFDPKMRWVGTALSGFGLIYNRDNLEKLGFAEPPSQWTDLVDERFFGQVALADPYTSGAFTMIFEIMIQQQMQLIYDQLVDRDVPVSMQQVAEVTKSMGWLKGLQLIQNIAANSRYFTSDPAKVVQSVSYGDSAVGTSIDFYGVFQEENLQRRSGTDRFGYIMPEGASAVSPDAIALLRGAPNREVAEKFIEYVLSEDGQKLWDYKVGVDGGPSRYHLSRAPIRKELFKPHHQVNRKNPNMDLYEQVRDFQYRPEWTSGLFREIRFAIKTAFIDVHPELVDAWEAIIQARHEGRAEAADHAFAYLQGLEPLSYENIINDIKPSISSGDALREVRLKSKITHHFKKRYLEAKRIAQGQATI